MVYVLAKEQAPLVVIRIGLSFAIIVYSIIGQPFQWQSMRLNLSKATLRLTETIAVCPLQPINRFRGIV